MVMRSANGCLYTAINRLRILIIPDLLVNNSLNFFFSRATGAGLPNVSVMNCASSVPTIQALSLFRTIVVFGRGISGMDMMSFTLRIVPAAPATALPGVLLYSNNTNIK